MRINNNISALNAWRGLTNTDNALSKSLEKLSSGLRINRAGDDAAGLAISEKMRGQIRGLNMAIKNAQDGISLIQTAEGALTESHAILQRMRELAVQAASDTNTNIDRGELQKEVTELIAELDRIADSTEFNTLKLLNGAQAVTVSGETPATYGIYEYSINIAGLADDDVVTIAGETFTFKGTNADTNARQFGSLSDLVDAINASSLATTYVASENSGNLVLTTVNPGASTAPTVTGLNLESETDGEDLIPGAQSGGLVFHIGANATQSMRIGIASMSASALGVKDIDLTSQDGADAAIAIIDKAIEDVSSERAKLGANQNRLEHTIKNLGVAAENLAAAESRIRDVDMAAEMMNFTRQNILMQAGTAMLAQANARPQSVLQLLG